ncbi:hypothetical protein D9M70_551150 [compost metagenome]
MLPPLTLVTSRALPSASESFHVSAHSGMATEPELLVTTRSATATGASFTALTCTMA